MVGGGGGAREFALFKLNFNPSPIRRLRLVLACVLAFRIANTRKRNKREHADRLRRH